ncbi:MAG: CPBP family intramembrane glutamic endopeptidase [Acidobacteriota bacterium]
MSRALSWLAIALFTAGVLAASPTDRMAWVLMVATPLALLQTWRRGGPSRLGFRRPASWRRLLAVSALAGLSLQAFSLLLLEPLVARISGETADLSALAAGVEGNAGAALSLLAVVWTLVAFGEEILFRGFLLGELERLLAGAGSAGSAGSAVASAAAILFSSLLFGLGHAYQGLAGLWVTGILGAALGLLYVASRRDLWLLILTHGMVDTAALVILYLGFYDDVELWARALWT